MEPALLLEKTKSAFTRLQTKNKRCHYPSHLIDNAVSLAEHYPIDMLAENLGITPVRLQAWLKPASQKRTLSPQFISLNLDEPMSMQTKIPDERITFTLHLPHHCSLSFSDQSIKSTASLICAMIQEVA